MICFFCRIFFMKIQNFLLVLIILLIVCFVSIKYFIMCIKILITRTFNPKKSFDLLVVSKSLSSFVLNVTPEFRCCFNNLISLSINAAIDGIVGSKSDMSRFMIELTSRKLYRSMLNAGKLKYKIEGLLLYLCPSFLFFLYKRYSLLRRIVK